MKALYLLPVVVLALAACSAPATQTSQDGPTGAAPTVTPTPTPTPSQVDVAKAKAGTAGTVEVTYTGTRIAAPNEIATSPKDGMVPAVLQFEYRNTGTDPVKLQAVPLTVFYGADKFEAKQPTLYQGGTTKTELPKQVVPGSVVKVADTYWVPAGAPVTVEVNPGGSSTPDALPVVFTGITAG